MDKTTVLDCLQICVDSARSNHYQEFNFDVETWDSKARQLIERLMQIELNEDNGDNNE